MKDFPRLAFLVSAVALFLFFLTRQSETNFWYLRISLTYIAYGGLTFFCFWGGVRLKQPSLFLVGMICAVAGYFLFKSVSWLQLGDGQFREVVPHLFALCSLAAFWSGIYLYRRNEELDRLLAHVLFPTSLICLLLFISHYTLPQPVQTLDAPAVTGFLVFCIITIGAAVGAHAFCNLGNTGAKKWVPTVIYYGASLGGLFFCLLWLNNVIYNGSYPRFPIGVAYEPDSEKTEKDLAVNHDSSAQPLSFHAPDRSLSGLPGIERRIVISKGGSLCGTLGLTRQEAAAFAARNDLSQWENGDTLYVLIFPGDVFVRRMGVWEEE